jgi:hypothetical protein
VRLLDLPYLASVPISFPLIGLTQLVQYLVVRCVANLTPGELPSRISGATGHSQGIVSAVVIASSGTFEEFADNSQKAIKQPDNKEGTPWMNHFKAYVFHSATESERMTIQLFSNLKEELQKLEEVRDESNFRKFLDHEDQQKRIEDIFVRINVARVCFEVRTMTFCSSVSSQCHFYVARAGCKSL